MNNQNPKDDVVGKPNAGTRDRGKEKLLHRPPNTEDELHDPKENKTSQNKVRRQQGFHPGNTN